jgi:hypothetical protein
MTLRIGNSALSLACMFIFCIPFSSISAAVEGGLHLFDSLLYLQYLKNLGA